ncbi:MAG: thioredoxin fold domain-containing protein [Gammaproteobacteria bacterium]|nr:thioredoxin fold domain-containing protein [Gammaproteobacteria bacterium]
MDYLNRSVSNLLSVILCLFVTVGTASADPPKGYDFKRYDDGMTIAKAESKRIFLYFGRYGCGWCDKTNKEAFSKEEVKNRYSRHYSLIYADAESGDRLSLPSGERITERELGVQLKAFATPLFAYFEPNGKLILKISGLQSAADLLLYDRYIHGEIYKKMGFRAYFSSQQGG